MCINFQFIHFYSKRKYGLYNMLSFVIKENNDEKWDICLPVFLKRKMCPQPNKINIFDVISHDMRLMQTNF